MSGITNYDIYEEVGVQIMGRGTGDRVGVLSSYRYQPSNLTKKVFANPLDDSSCKENQVT
jgi:hypothetical protein